ncbi:hypothetical protein F383_34823 [Gossypium arboreum]|uniref:Uncharacterized protein n=1 Tax=Gossypium arboreum TaxID=29729 RepID=A0A0B0PUF8_GOSAR|nr:hypothetical protein F383_34823 [Gossypium arboreum]
MCHTQLRYMPVSIPVRTKMGYLPSHIATQI